MPKCLCSKCGKEYRWHNRRGMRLADYTSLCCQAPLHNPSKGKAKRHPYPYIKAKLGVLRYTVDLESNKSIVTQKEDYRGFKDNIRMKVELRDGIPVTKYTFWGDPRAIDGDAVNRPGYIVLWENDGKQRHPSFYYEYLLDKKDYQRLLEKAGQKNYLQQAGDSKA